VPDSSVTAGVVEETLPTSIENGSMLKKRADRSENGFAKRHVLNTLNGCLCGEVVDSLKSPPSNELLSVKR
jgi:hypothetical protein